MPGRILLIDDEGDIVRSLQHRLEREGHTVAVAANGNEAMAVARTQTLDLVITDVAMAGMDGYHFYQQFRKIPQCQSTPVIVVTGHTHMEDAFRSLGIEDFLSKPVDMDRLVTVVQRVLDPAWQRKKKHRIVVLGVDQKTVQKMVQDLRDHGRLAEAARDEMDLLTRTLTHRPTMVIIDVLLECLLAHELIKALRCFAHLSDLIILTYTHFTEKELTNPDAVEQLKESKNACLQAGATAYIGRFSRVTFMEYIDVY